MEKRLLRNEHDKVIAGVCSGLADYTQMDVTIIKVLFILFTIFGGMGALVYIVLWIVVPVNNDPAARFKKFNDFYQQNDPNQMFNSANAFNNPTQNAQTKWNTENVGPEFQPADPFTFKPASQNSDNGKTIGGLILLAVGSYLLLKYTFGIIPNWFSIWRLYKLWPLVLVVIGISLIFRNQRKTEWEKFKKSTAEAQNATSQPVETPVEPTDSTTTTTTTNS